MKLPDLIPEKEYGRLTFLRHAESINGQRRGIFWCRCGTVKKIREDGVKAGLVQSCGCLNKENAKAKGLKFGPQRKTHGQSWAENRTHEYSIWQGMMTRCYNESCESYERYGARGISVCPQWQGPGGFEQFFRDVGPIPDHLSLDRWPDNDGNYCPENVRKATAEEQQRNKNNNRILNFQNRDQPLVSWAEEVGISATAIQKRLTAGWSVERALTEPVRTRKSRYLSLTYKNETKAATTWAREFSISPATLCARIHAGWSVEEALETPARDWRRKNEPPSDLPPAVA